MHYTTNDTRASMQANIIGQVNNTQLGKNKTLQALYELISNSIHAIEDTQTRTGSIAIDLIRPQALLPNSEKSRSPITGFVILDDGIGFTPNNYQSFNETNSQLKQHRGGKGLGRFTLLKAFERVDIESVFHDNGSCYQRNFTFSLADKSGISDHTNTPIDTCTSYSKVQLLNVREEYKKGIPISAEKLAYKTVEHFLEYFVLEKMPPVTIADATTEEQFDLQEIYQQLVADNETADILIEQYNFRISHFILQPTTSKDHCLYLTGHQRVGEKLSLTKLISNLPRHIALEDQEGCIYACYVSSKYLDSRINPVRIGFDLPKQKQVHDMFPELDRETILEHICTACTEYLKSFIESVRENKNQRIKRYVESHAPEYRHIIKNHLPLLDEIPPDVDELDIDNHLHTLGRRIEDEVREKAKSILTDEPTSDDADYHEKRKQAYQTFFTELNDLSKSALSKYILDRRLVLDVFEHALTLNDNDKYAIESKIHELIFPIRKSSDDISPEEHNLWLIDERLVYHHYLASDMLFSKMAVMESNSLDRPDLLIFNHCFAITEEENSFSGITLFEFKRPMRTNYPDDPFQQIFKYIKQIRKGAVKDKSGRPVKVTASTQFYSYLICDLTDGIVNSAKDFSLKQTADQQGYVGYHSGHETYLEVISFDKLLLDAKKRNQILFDKLGLPKKIPITINP